MRKTEVSVEGLRILRTEGEITLKHWAAGGIPDGNLLRQENLRTAVREASERIEAADKRAPGATQ